MILQDMATALTHARIYCQPIPQFSKNKETEKITRNDAYHVQEKGTQYRIDQGEKLAGFKMGLTSEAKRKQMNLDSPLYGELTNQMQVPNQGSLSLKNLIHPKIEPEIAFFLHSPLTGPQVTRAEALAACSAIAPALEILDSRYREFRYFSMEDVISDNSSSSHFVVGPKVTDFSRLNLTDLPLTLKVNGQAVQQGNTKAISGDPVQSLIDLCHLLAQRGRQVEAGSLVLAGAATPAVPLELGLISVEIESLDSASLSITNTNETQ